jgi:hypothetical protein
MLRLLKSSTVDRQAELTHFWAGTNPGFMLKFPVFVAFVEFAYV